MAIELRSVSAKLDRAKEHLRVLKDEVSPLLSGKPYKVVTKINAESTRYSLFAKQLVPDPPFERWSLMLADCFHNLRSSLDHLIYAIAVHESGIDPPPKGDSIQFPICDTPDEFFTGNSGVRKIRTLSDKVRTAVEWVQPYNRRHTSIRPPMAILRDAVNTDKHKFLRLTYATLTEGKFSLIGGSYPPVPAFPFGHTGEIKDGTEIGGIVFERPNPGMEFKDIEFELVIGVWHGKREDTDPDWMGRSEFSQLADIIFDEVGHAIKFVSGWAR